MNGAHLHIILNHVPVITCIISTCILIWGWWTQNIHIQRVGLVLAVVTALFGIGTYLTGDPAEDILKKLPNFSKDLVHEHEEAGEFALIASIIIGINALASLLLSKRKPKFARYAFLAALILGVWASSVFLRTAYLGGLIKHEEVR